MFYFRLLLLLICISILLFFYLNPFFITKTTESYKASLFASENHKNAFFCTFPPTLDEKLLYLFYTPQDISLKKQQHPCFLINEIEKMNQKTPLIPPEILKKLVDQYCSIVGPNSIYITHSTWDSFLYRLPDQPVFCQTPNNCADILFESPSLLILSWRNWGVEAFVLLTPYHYRQSYLSVSPFFLYPLLNVGSLEKHIELSFTPGGLGNHLFQYWSAKIYALKNHRKLSIRDLRRYKLFHVFDIPELDSLNEPDSLSSQPLSIQLFYRKSKKISSQTLAQQSDFKPLKVEGYLQSYKNFEGYEDYIRQHTRFKYPLSSKNKKIANYMQKQNSILIHVRRGDYIKLGYTILTPDYYQKAIQYMNKHVKNPHYYIFSNDIQWAKENLSIKEPHTFVDWNKKDYEDLQLMTYCKHFIIANSTFSWWGAFLSKNPDKIVIAPDKWIHWAPLWQEELILPNWIRQKNE